MALSPETIDRLKSQLLTSGLSRKDPPLYQVINQLIGILRDAVEGITQVIIIGGSGGSLSNATYLTSTDESALLPNSRQLLPGTDIGFDDSIPNQRTINFTGSIVDREWSVLTNGSVDFPELIFVGGDVVMLHTP